MATAMEPFGDLPLEPFLPPPRKIFRRGTTELATALQKGEVELSLPQYELTAWMRGGGSGSPCEERGDRSNEDSAKRVSEVDAQNSLQRRSSFDRDSEQVTEEVEGEGCKSKDLQRRPKKRTRREKYPKFNDIIGHHHVKLRLEEVLLPLALPSHIADNILTGIRANPTSIFMYGPPGCGKTELAKALAGEAEAAFLPVGPSDILSKFVGESEASIRSIFKKEANHTNSKCAILFFDEIDALGQARGGRGTSSMTQGGNDGCSRRVLAELLIQLNRITAMDYGSMDQCHDSDGKPYEKYSSDADAKCQTRVRIIVVAATNRLEDCDPALVRRFSVRVVVSLPTQHDRSRIIKRFLKGIENNISTEEFDDIATATNGWSGADLEHLTREAAMAPVRECIRSAALQKYRLGNRHEQARNGPDLFPETAGTDMASWARQEKLLHHFRKLREVTYEDFLDAIQFWLDNHQVPNTPKAACGRRSPTSVVLSECGSDEDD